MARVGFIALLLTVWSCAGYDPTDEKSVASQCLEAACENVVTVYGGDKPVTFKCGVASGALPLQVPPTLPLYYQGNFDLCSTFKQAHYCTIRTGPIPIPEPYLFTPGDFRLNQCVSKTCTEALLSSSFKSQVKTVTDWIIKRFTNDTAVAEAIEKYFNDTLVVDCMEKRERLDSVGVFVIVIFALSVILVLMATLIELGLLGESQWESISAWRNSLVGIYSCKRNFSRLVAQVPGDFGALNGIRVISMFWIICGHTLLQFVDPPVINSTAIQRFAQSYAFALFRGAEYAVDTFFFMSAFLATVGIVKQLKARALTPGTYGSFVVARYLRLTPAYAFVLFGFWKVTAVASDGPFWGDRNRSASSANVAPCSKYWWTNMLYINNLVPFGSPESCAGWTWYLANDFQFFLFAPLLVAFYASRYKTTPRTAVGMLQLFAPCLVLILVQWISMSATMVHFKMNGAMSPFTDSSKKWWGHVYVTPWTRMSPYVFGVMLGLFHDYRVDQLGERDWKAWVVEKPRLAAASFFGGLAVMFGLVSAHYFQWRCKDTQENCDAWMGYIYNGFFIDQNWDRGFATFFYTVAYLTWSVALAAVCYPLFSGYAAPVNSFLSSQIFAPFARLTYVAYLFHIPVQSLVHFAQPTLPFFAGYNILMEVIGYIVLAYSLSFIVYMTIEKPCMSLVSKLMMKKRSSSPASSSTAAMERRDGASVEPEAPLLESDRHRLMESRFSAVSDLDSESVAMATPGGTLITSDQEAQYERLLPRSED